MKPETFHRLEGGYEDNLGRNSTPEVWRSLRYVRAFKVQSQTGLHSDLVI